MPRSSLPKPALPVLPLDVTLLKPGLRLAVGLSGGADSVALTRALADRAGELGLVLHIAHLHHGLRGSDADQDQAFSADLAHSLSIPYHTANVDTLAASAKDPAEGKAKESIEEAARRLRYQWFRELMASGQIEAVATAHTLDDQAETVLGKFLRGAWTEGLSGIHPVVNFAEGRILRPILSTSRKEIEKYLQSIGQPWREDASNQDHAFTRNRIRHQLLPELEHWNPQIRQHLANMARLAQAEEQFWQSEISRLAPQFLLIGRPVRGGGRAVGSDSTSIAVDAIRLSGQPAAIQRRLLRHAVSALGVALSYEATETLRQLLTGRSSQKATLAGSIGAERTARELRLTLNSPQPADPGTAAEHALPVPGEITAFGYHFAAYSPSLQPHAVIRNWRPGDRVTLRYSSGPRKIKEVLERLKVTGSARRLWPVVEWQGQIIWMPGAELQPVAAVTISAKKEEDPEKGPPLASD